MKGNPTEPKIEKATPRAAHWEKVYQERHAQERSWFQPAPNVALELIDSLALPHTAAVIDVGGGTSRLAEGLLERGIDNVTVVDISPSAVAEAKERLGENAARVHWLVGDVTTLELTGPYDVWHDRAVFHFLTDADDRQRYLSTMRRALRSRGHVIIATFAPDGPERCSGLPVMRYSPEQLADELAPQLTLVTSRRELHATPQGKEQRFVYCVFQDSSELTA